MSRHPRRDRLEETELRSLVIHHLDQPGDAEPWSARSGSVLFSDVASIRRGRFYVMGINPGGSEEKAGANSVIRDHLSAPVGTNSYADECWSCESPYRCVHCEGGRLRPGSRHPMQHRVCDLFDAPGEQPKDLPSTNLIFARSSEYSKLRGNKKEWKQRCWNVHRDLLGRIQPHWVVTLGFGEAFSTLRGRGKETSAQSPIGDDAKSLAWHCRLKIDLSSGDDHEIGVLGVAHPGNRGFNRAGLSGSLQYPDALKRFIELHLFTDKCA